MTTITTYELDYNEHFYSEANRPHTQSQKEELAEILDDIANRLDVEWNECEDGLCINLTQQEYQQAKKLLPDEIELHDVDQEVLVALEDEFYEDEHEYVGDNLDYNDFVVDTDY